MNQAITAQLDAIVTAAALQQSQDDFIAGKGTVYNGLQRLPASIKEALFKFSQPGNVGNSGGSSIKPHGTYVWTPGDPATLTVNPVTTNEDNFYFFAELPLPDALPSRVVDFRQHTIADLTNWQGVEWQQQLTYGGRYYNMAWQFSSSSGVRYYDKANETWKSTAIPLPDFTKGVLSVAEFSLNVVGVTHVALTLNGVRYPVNIVQPAPLTTNGNKFTIAEQIDPKRGKQCTLSIGNIELRYI